MFALRDSLTGISLNSIGFPHMLCKSLNDKLAGRAGGELAPSGSFV